MRERSPQRRALPAQRFDRNKDQSYFLYRLKPFQPSADFSVGRFWKNPVRRLAAEFKLPTAAKKDSTGICFIGERPFREFLQKYLPTDNGKMATPEAENRRRTRRATFYTLGQRKGLGIGGAGEPWFVAAKDLTKKRTGLSYKDTTIRCSIPAAL